MTVMMELIEAGIVTNRRKKLNNGKSVFCFALGSKKLYDFINHNPGMAGFPVDYTNNPAVIAEHRRKNKSPSTAH